MAFYIAPIPTGVSSRRFTYILSITYLGTLSQQKHKFALGALHTYFQAYLGTFAQQIKINLKVI